MIYIKKKLEKLIRECDRHLFRIKRAGKNMEPFMPLNVKRYKNLTETEIEHIDQFIFRFTKLQDGMGNKLFRALLMALGEENVKNMPFIDMLNRLEKLNVIDSAKDWMVLREIRNQLAHEYEDDENTYAYINLVYEKSRTLETIYMHVKNYMIKRDMVSD
ncbi:MAG: hypothetical protein R6W70_04000 [bacterium]